MMLLIIKYKPKKTKRKRKRTIKKKRITSIPKRAIQKSLGKIEHNRINIIGDQKKEEVSIKPRKICI